MRRPVFDARAALRVAAFTGGTDVPSARFRIRQYGSALLEKGIVLDEFPATFGAYPPRSVVTRPAWFVASCAQRLPGLLASRRYELTVFQRELISTLPTFEFLAGEPRILDVDDAIWLRRGGLAARQIARKCDAVVCGNAFLADRFSAWNSSVCVIPTAVDLDRFTPRCDRGTDTPVLGWSGVSSGFRLLSTVESAIAHVLEIHPEWKFRVVSDVPPRFERIQPHRVEFVRWTPEREVEMIQGMDVGIMPLDASEWSLGKCSYKMLLYMACAVPVVVSDVGMNSEVLRRGAVGIGVRALGQWGEAMDELMSSEDLRRSMGLTGRRIVEGHYSVSDAAEAWANLIRRVVGR